MLNMKNNWDLSEIGILKVVISLGKNIRCLTGRAITALWSVFPENHRLMLPSLYFLVFEHTKKSDEQTCGQFLLKLF